MSQTLEKVIAYIDQYIPQYVDVLRLQGKLITAVNVYLDSLDKYPILIDVVTWLNWGFL